MRVKELKEWLAKEEAIWLAKNMEEYMGPFDMADLLMPRFTYGTYKQPLCEFKGYTGDWDIHWDVTGLLILDVKPDEALKR
jgi:hypothetical protein